MDVGSSSSYLGIPHNYVGANPNQASSPFGSVPMPNPHQPSHFGSHFASAPPLMHDPAELAYLHEKLDAQQQHIDSVHAREASLQNQLDAVKNEFSLLVERFTTYREKVDGHDAMLHRLSPNPIADAIRSIFASSTPSASKPGDGKAGTAPSCAGPYCTASPHGYGNAYSFPTKFSNPYSNSRSGFGWGFGTGILFSSVSSLALLCLLL